MRRAALSAMAMAVAVAHDNEPRPRDESMLRFISVLMHNICAHSPIIVNVCVIEKSSNNEKNNSYLKGA